MKLSKAAKVVSRLVDARTRKPISGLAIGLRLANHPKSELVQLPGGRAAVNKAPVEVAMLRRSAEKNLPISTRSVSEESASLTLRVGMFSPAARLIGSITTSDANGDYSISDVRKGEYTIEFMKGVDPVLAARNVTHVILESGDTLRADFEHVTDKGVLMKLPCRRSVAITSIQLCRCQRAVGNAIGCEFTSQLHRESQRNRKAAKTTTAVLVVRH